MRNSVAPLSVYNMNTSVKEVAHTTTYDEMLTMDSYNIMPFAYRRQKDRGL